jgi:hypothetical protein
LAIHPNQAAVTDNADNRREVLAAYPYSFADWVLSGEQLTDRTLADHRWYGRVGAVVVIE